MSVNENGLAVLVNAYRSVMQKDMNILKECIVIHETLTKKQCDYITEVGIVV